MPKYILTKEGHENVLKELDELKNQRHAKAVDRLKRARDMGDLSENSEYHAAKEDLAYIDGRIQEIEQILQDVEVMKEVAKTNNVNVGSIVDVEINGLKSTFTIVGELEADIHANKLSYQSPIGKALMNARKGETVKFNTPRGPMEYKILDIK